MKKSPFTSREAFELAEKLSLIVQSGVPLPAGFRAAARECSSRRVARALDQLAARIDRGQPHAGSPSAHGIDLPPYLTGLIAAGIRTGHLSETLVQLVQVDCEQRDLWRRIRWALAYPLFVTLLLGAVCTFILLVVVPEMKAIYLETRRSFQWEDTVNTISGATQTLFWLSESGWKVIGGAAVGAIVVAIAVRLLGGAAMWVRLVSCVPAVGRLIHDGGTVELTRLLRLLLLEQVPLPEAVRLTQTAVRNADIAETAGLLAEAADRGLALSHAIDLSNRLPPSAVPLVEWGEKVNAVPEALDVISQLLSQRMQQRARLLAVVGPPVIFILIAATALAMIAAMMLPLVGFIDALSW